MMRHCLLLVFLTFFMGCVSAPSKYFKLVNEVETQYIDEGIQVSSCWSPDYNQLNLCSTLVCYDAEFVDPCEGCKSMQNQVVSLIYTLGENHILADSGQTDEKGMLAFDRSRVLNAYKKYIASLGLPNSDPSTWKAKIQIWANQILISETSLPQEFFDLEFKVEPLAEGSL